MQLQTQIKAGIIAGAFKAITGYEPMITERPDGSAYLVFKTEEIPKIRASLQQLTVKAGKATGDVSVSIAPVLLPLVLKYALPVIIGLVAGGAFLGYAAGKDGKGLKWLK
jgi:hypothetical protein